MINGISAGQCRPSEFDQRLPHALSIFIPSLIVGIAASAIYALRTADDLKILQQDGKAQGDTYISSESIHAWSCL